jgi:hypothetical protein
VPFAYSKKSSPGATFLSMPAVSKPNVPYWGFGAGAASGTAGAAAAAGGGGGGGGAWVAHPTSAVEAIASARSFSITIPSVDTYLLLGWISVRKRRYSQSTAALN